MPQMILEQESADYLSDENEEDFDAYKSDYEYQVPLPPLLLVEETNDPVCKLNPTTRTNFSPCILVDYIDDKLQTCGQKNNCEILIKVKLAADVAYYVSRIFIFLVVELDVKIIYGKYGKNIFKFHVLVFIHVMLCMNAKVFPNEFLMMFRQFDIFVIIVTNLMVGI